MKTEITTDNIITKKIKSKTGKLHIFKMAPRVEAKHRICVVSETGVEGPIIKVIGKLGEGKGKYNYGKQFARFYDPETKMAYTKWIADDDLILAVTKADKRIIYITGAEEEIKDKETNQLITYFKIYGSEISDEVAD